jgi:hypothetical protein
MKRCVLSLICVASLSTAARADLKVCATCEAAAAPTVRPTSNRIVSHAAQTFRPAVIAGTQNAATANETLRRSTAQDQQLALPGG